MRMEWISVKDRLPLDDGDVLVYSRKIGGIISIDCYDVTNKIWLDSASWGRIVTHWMPLPEIPV